MASRRELKKYIKFISIELITECYVKYTLLPKLTDKEVSKILLKINKLNYNLIGRINNAEGKDNKKITKVYYKKIIEDWNSGVEEIVKDIEKLGK
jgi:hypothetical protein